MAEHTNQTTNTEQEPTFSVVTVPKHLREQVEDYVRQLEGGADTSAYMLSLSGANRNWTGTDCQWVDSGGLHDLACGDKR
jgi:hypothetical protein